MSCSDGLPALCVALALAAPAAAQEKPVSLTSWGDHLQNLTWSPDGKKFLVTRIHRGQMGLWTANADGSEPRALFPKEINPTLDGGWRHDSAKIVYVFDRLQGTDGKFQIDVANPDGSDAKNLLPHKAFDESPRFSPDGKSIVFVSTRDKNQDIWTMDASGQNLKRLTSDPAADNSPCWSPDGKRIAFASARAGSFDVWTMNADGSDARKIAASPRLDTAPAWSPDGKRIAFVSLRDGNSEVYLTTPDGASVTNLTRHPGHDHWPTWSPDGRRLAWISNRSGSAEIYVVDVAH